MAETAREPKPHSHVDRRLWRTIPDPYRRRGWTAKECSICGKFIGCNPVHEKTIETNE